MNPQPPGAVFAIVNLRVQPGAQRTRVVGMLGDAVKVAVNAAPEKGKANKAVERLLADQFGLPVSSVSVISGETSRSKRVRIEGMSAARLNEWLAGLAAK